MAETVNSQTQHIAALDFDITQAVRQLEQLQNRVEEITNLLNSQNWSVNATISGENGVRAYADELVNAQNRITELEEEIANMREQMEQASQTGVQATSVLVGILSCVQGGKGDPSPTKICAKLPPRLPSLGSHFLERV